MSEKGKEDAMGNRGAGWERARTLIRMRERVKKITCRNLCGLLRYALIRLRYRHIRCGIFFIDSGASLHIGPVAEVIVGRDVRIMRDFTGYFEGRVTIGDGVFFNRGCHVVARACVSIGDHCLFGELVSIHDDNHVTGPGSEPIASRGIRSSPVIIGRNVWVGAKATILAGVEIGDNAVIGAGAVVTRAVPSHAVVAGVPARVVREGDRPR